MSSEKQTHSNDQSLLRKQAEQPKVPSPQTESQPMVLTGAARKARMTPRLLKSREILQLQRTIGNRAVSSLLASPQPPLQLFPDRQREIFPQEEDLPAQSTFSDRQAAEGEQVSAFASAERPPELNNSTSFPIQRAIEFEYDDKTGKELPVNRTFTGKELFTHLTKQLGVPATNKLLREVMRLDEANAIFSDTKELLSVLRSNGTIYVPTRLPEMSDKDYQDYVTSSNRWMKNRADKEVAKLKVGNYLYHGTSEGVAKIVAKEGLKPADPTFRKAAPRKKRWDASRDGFLSMATGLKGVTVTAKSVILRMKIEPGDLEYWEWKQVGGADEVVSTVPIPPDRLEWSANKKDWHPMNEGLED